jgi:hypothetical protein
MKKAKNCKDKTFYEITNTDIWNKLCEIEKHVIKTNGKVKMNTVWSRMALGLSVIALAILTGINLGLIIL